MMLQYSRRKNISRGSPPLSATFVTRISYELSLRASISSFMPLLRSRSRTLRKFNLSMRKAPDWCWKRPRAQA